LVQTWDAPILRSARRFARRKPLSAAAALSLFLVMAVVAVGPFVMSSSPTIGNLRDHLEAPSAAHLLGTDEQGRDVWTRLVYGGRMSLAVGLGASLFSTIAGSIYGTISGYIGGRTDMIMQRIADAMMAIPGIILLMVLTLIFEPSVRNVVLAIGILYTPSISRVVRSAVLTVREEPYIEAVRSLGASAPRVMIRHILPNCFAAIIVIASVLVGAGIVTEAGLGFLGLSVAPPNPTWGNMLNAGAQNYMEQAPWLAVAPGAAIAITVFSVNLLGDGLRDVLDPRLRGTT
jgi:peptide/nickel transport system permease protein